MKSTLTCLTVALLTFLLGMALAILGSEVVPVVWNEHLTPAEEPQHCSH